jgi:hypothetical protein
VQFSNVDHGFKQIEILNLEGKIVKSFGVDGNPTNMVINLDELSKGSYVVRFVSDEGTVSHMIVK